MKPILFNTEMVRANLDNRKTSTRRVVKGFIPENAKWGYTAFTPRGHISCRGVFADGYGEKFYKLPYQPSDILYVRETWALVPDENSDWRYRYCYKSDNEPVLVERWSPSIHMPKEAARIFLQVKDVRVERLQNITGRGVLAEGVDNGYANPAMGVRWENAQRMAFSEVWNSTIKPSKLGKYGWNANPWCWVIEYERCDKPTEGE